MKQITILMAALAVSLFLLALTFPGSAYGQEGGQEQFMAEKCNMCHGVESAGIEAKMSGKMAGPDLTGTVERHGAELLTEYLRGDAEIDGAKHKKKFTGSDEELGALVEWLSQQKAE